MITLRMHIAEKISNVMGSEVKVVGMTCGN